MATSVTSMDERPVSEIERKKYYPDVIAAVEGHTLVHSVSHGARVVLPEPGE